MGLQARFSADDKRLYRPERDVAHNFGSIAMVVAQRLEELENNPNCLTAFKKHFNVTDAQLGQACAAFCKFVPAAADPKTKSMVESLSESGWFEVEEPAQFLYMALLGTVISGVYWAGVREASVAEHSPAENYQELANYGRDLSRRMTIPKWRRGLYVGWQRIKDAFHILTRRA